MLKNELSKHTQQGKRTDLQTSPKNLEEVTKGTDEIIGKMFKESHEMVRKRRYVFERLAKVKNHPNLKKRIDSGKPSISFAYDMLLREEQKKRPTPDLPEGEFEVIFPDFPWQYNYPNPNSPSYKTMTVDEIKKEFPQLPAYKNCVLLMWATAPLLLEALELIKFYGFIYKTQIIWIKTKDKNLFHEEEIADTKLQQNTGPNVNGAHELLLISTKGNPGTPLYKPSSVIFAERTESGRKPREFARLIEKMYPAKKRLEMFARKKDSEDDDLWTRYGDQVQD